MKADFNAYFEKKMQMAEGKDVESKPIDKVREEMEQEKLNALVQEGKDKYDKADTRGKIETMLKMKNNPLDREHTTLRAYRDAMEEKKDITVFSIGTTGLKSDDEIMQICFQTFKFDNEKNEYVRSDRMGKIVRASDEVINRALETRDKYDIFKEGGFGRPVEKGGTGVTEVEYISRTSKFVYEKDKASEKINEYLKNHEDSVFFGINPSSLNHFAEDIGINMPVSYDIQDVYREFDHEQYESGEEEYLNTSGKSYTFVNMIYNTIGAEGAYSSYQKSSYEMQLLNFIAEREKLLNKEEKTVETEEVNKETEEFKETIGVTPEMWNEMLEAQKRTEALLSKIVEAMTEVITIDKSNMKTNEGLRRDLKGLTKSINEYIKADDKTKDIEEHEMDDHDEEEKGA